MNCPNCKAYNPGSANFCAQCGAALAAPTDEVRGDQDQSSRQEEQRPAPEVPASEAQRPAAAETVEYAGFWVRGAALVIDVLAITVIQLILIGLEPTTILANVVGIAYPVLFIGLRGQTPGKMIIGIKVVKPGRETPGIGTAILREIFGKFVSGIALGLGYAWAGWDPWKQAWHDKIAGTYAVRTRSGLYQPPPR